MMKQPIDLEGICGELRKTANAVYLACPAPVADDIAYKLRNAASEIERLQAENERLEGADIAMGAMQGLLDELRDDFIDYACGGVPNLAPYCGNKTDACVDGRGWCNNAPGACKGFCPSAWRGFSERAGGHR